MKASIKNFPVVIVLILLLSQISYSQHPKNHKKEIQSLTNYVGKIISFSVNNDKIYDGFQMDINGTSTRVAFPKHLGKQIMGIAKAGSVVTVNGFMDYSPIGEPEVRRMFFKSYNFESFQY